SSSSSHHLPLFLSPSSPRSPLHTPPLRLPSTEIKTHEQPSFTSMSVRLGPPLPADAQGYIQLTQAGVLFHHLMARAKIPESERGEFKKKFFGEVFFGKNWPVTKRAEQFAAEFPSVSRVVRELKDPKHARLARILQRTEASLMIDRVARRCMD